MSLSLAGIIEAGFPSAAYDFNEDRITLDEFLIDRRESSYMLKVASNSFKDQGILSGDYVIVERGAQAKKGDIVVLRTSESFVLALFDTQAQGVDSIDEYIVEAVVRSVVRKY